MTDTIVAIPMLRYSLKKQALSKNFFRLVFYIIGREIRHRKKDAWQVKFFPKKYWQDEIFVL